MAGASPLPFLPSLMPISSIPFTTDTPSTTDIGAPPTADSPRHSRAREGGQPLSAGWLALSCRSRGIATRVRTPVASRPLPHTRCVPREGHCPGAYLFVVLGISTCLCAAPQARRAARGWGNQIALKVGLLVAHVGS
ncbi:hypothetical protein C2E23DRAFT_71304 [Lenzites betulinus]|nr:hypothetical protein C2E23DRAFT_71304 [Lenzites betulinus]